MPLEVQGPPTLLMQPQFILMLEQINHLLPSKPGYKFVLEQMILELMILEQITLEQITLEQITLEQMIQDQQDIVVGIIARIHHQQELNGAI